MRTGVIGQVGRDYVGTLGSVLFRPIPLCSAKALLTAAENRLEAPEFPTGAISSVGRASRLHGECWWVARAQES